MQVLRIFPFTAILSSLLLLYPRAVNAQELPPDGSTARGEAIRLFLDCSRCDSAHIRGEITFVNHVRDPNLAQVHVLVTDQPTGGGGRLYTMAFLGRGDLAGVDNTLTYHSAQSNSTAQERDGLVAILKLGLASYAARTPLAPALTLHFEETEGAMATPLYDPWRHWTFEVYGGGNLDFESNQNAWSARYGFYANHVSEEWKVQLRPYFNHSGRVIRRDEGDVRSKQRRHGFDSYLIRSVGPYWGAGLFGNYLTDTRDNLRHRYTVSPGVEYSVYPYAESTRRQITFTYRVSLERVDYYQETIYEKLEETLGNHSLDASARFRQPWGSVFASVRGSSYLHDRSFNRLTLNGNVSLRLGRGVSLNLSGNYQSINDQLGLPRGDASLEDILLERRRLATSYRTSGSVGLSYTFGSIFTNVVNPRF
jgi:hypothetical protein